MNDLATCEDSNDFLSDQCATSLLNSLVSTGDTGRQPPPSAPTGGDLSRHNNS